MEEIIKSVSDKISSYNLFNNLLPGVIFCTVVNDATRFSISSENIIEQVVIWYFVGMIISRIGSIYVEGGLKRLKFKNKKSLVFADYKQYSVAAEAKPFIATLSETNSIYRTAVSLLVVLEIVFLYDKLLYDWIESKCVIGNTLIAGVAGLFLILLFIQSYKKQTDYVRKQVEKYASEQE